MPSGRVWTTFQRSQVEASFATIRTFQVAKDGCVDAMSSDGEPRDLAEGRPAGPRVLHVVESWGGGVQAAVLSYVNSTPECAHFLLYSSRGADVDTRLPLTQFVSIARMSRSPFAARASIREACCKYGPDVIHLHSSIAGVLGRLSLSRRRVGIVYTPHCFAFERLSVKPWRRWLDTAGEALMARNTSVIAGCSRHEVELAHRLSRDVETVFVPNVATCLPISDIGIRQRARAPRRGSVVASGRACAQKDPSFFVQACRSSMNDGHAEDWTWLGGGLDCQEGIINEAGLRCTCTGWLSHADVMSRLADADVYVHTAAWEGFPVSLLEAYSLGLPIVARAIGAFLGAPQEWLVRTPDEMAQKVAILNQSARLQEVNRREWGQFLSVNTPEMQSRMLMDAYRAASASVKN